jgi:hypothetical protein
MSLKSLVDMILGAEYLTRGLGDAEARLLVEWLVDRTEAIHAAKGEAVAHRDVERLCRRLRSVARFVVLWCCDNERGAAHQLAATERFAWPLPAADVEPWDLLHEILQWEGRAAITRQAA